MVRQLEDGMTFTLKAVKVKGGTIFEQITADDSLGFGEAYACERESKPHHHDETVEIYVVLRGRAYVRTYNGKFETLGVGGIVKIPEKVSHNIVNASEDCIIKVFTFPAYNPDDVIIE